MPRCCENTGRASQQRGTVGEQRQGATVGVNGLLAEVPFPSDTPHLEDFFVGTQHVGKCPIQAVLGAVVRTVVPTPYQNSAAV